MVLAGKSQDRWSKVSGSSHPIVWMSRSPSPKSFLRHHYHLLYDFMSATVRHYAITILPNYQLRCHFSDWKRIQENSQWFWPIGGRPGKNQAIIAKDLGTRSHQWKHQKDSQVFRGDHLLIIYDVYSHRSVARDMTWKKNRYAVDSNNQEIIRALSSSVK